MCEDPNVWYTGTGEKVVDEIAIPTVKPELSDSITEEIVLVDLSNGVIED